MPLSDMCIHFRVLRGGEAIGVTSRAVGGVTGNCGRCREPDIQGALVVFLGPPPVSITCVLAERVGFEPTVLVKVHTLSKRAP